MRARFAELSIARLQLEDAAGFTTPVAIGFAVQRLAPAVRGQHARLLEHHAGVRGQGEVYPSDQGGLAIRGLHTGGRHVQSH